MLSMLITAWVAGQGQALELHYPTEPGLTGVAVRWSGHAVPFVRHGDQWLTVVGVDLDSRPGEHAVDVTFSYADGRTRVIREPVTVSSQKFPTTELTVEERFVAAFADPLAQRLHHPRDVDAPVLRGEGIGHGGDSNRRCAVAEKRRRGGRSALLGGGRCRRLRGGPPSRLWHGS